MFYQNQKARITTKDLTQLCGSEASSGDAWIIFLMHWLTYSCQLNFLLVAFGIGSLVLNHCVQLFLFMNSGCIFGYFCHLDNIWICMV